MAGNEQEDGFFSAATGAMGCTEDLYKLWGSCCIFSHSLLVTEGTAIILKKARRSGRRRK